MKKKLLAVLLGTTLVFGQSMMTRAGEAAADEASQAVEDAAEETEKKAEETADEAVEAVDEAADEAAEATTDETAEEGGLLGLLGSILEETDVEELTAEDGAIAGAIDTLSSAFSEEGGGLGGMISGLTDTLSDHKEEIVNGISSTFGVDAGAVNDLVSGLTDENGSLDIGGLISKFTAEDGGLASQLLSGILGEDGLKLDPDQLKGLVDSFRTEDGSLDFEAIGDVVSGLLGNADAMGELEKFFDGVENAVLTLNDGMYDPSDESFVVEEILDFNYDESTGYVLGDFWQYNYNIQDKDLAFASGGCSTGILRMVKAEDGSWKLDEADLAGDGEGFSDDVHRIIEEAGYTYEEYEEATEDSELYYLEKLSEYADEHPEIERIEVDNEFLTVEELNARLSEILEKMFGDIEEEVEAEAEEIEAAGEELVDEAEATLEDAETELEEAAQELEEQAAETAGSVEDAANAAVETIEDAADALEDAAAEAVENVEEAAPEEEKAVA